MGILLDSTILIAGERRKEEVEQVLERIRTAFGDGTVAVSTISIVEIAHGIYRTPVIAERERRRLFLEELSRDPIVQPLTIEIAQLAGRTEGEQAAKGIGIPFEDLLIGAAALHLSFGVATLNLRQFRLIPNLSVTSL